MVGQGVMAPAAGDAGQRAAAGPPRLRSSPGRGHASLSLYEVHLNKTLFLWCIDTDPNTHKDSYSSSVCLLLLSSFVFKLSNKLWFWPSFVLFLKKTKQKNMTAFCAHYQSSPSSFLHFSDDHSFRHESLHKSWLLAETCVKLTQQCLVTERDNSLQDQNVLIKKNKKSTSHRYQFSDDVQYSIS